MKYPTLLVALTLLLHGQQQVRHEKEIAFGRALNAELRRGTPAIQDAMLADYVSKLAGRLNVCAQSPLPLTIEVTTNPTKCHISALPGGFLRIPLGAFTQSETETDFAFALAHAMAHVVERHGFGKSTAIEGLANVPLIFTGSHIDGEDDALVPSAMLPRVREAEKEADRFASSWIVGFEPSGEFEAVKKRAMEWMPTRKHPTLRRASERH